MGNGERKKLLKYEKPELVDMMRTGAEGQDYCDTGTGAENGCYPGVDPGVYGCYDGTGVVGA